MGISQGNNSLSPDFEREFTKVSAAISHPQGEDFDSRDSTTMNYVEKLLASRPKVKKIKNKFTLSRHFKQPPAILRRITYSAAGKALAGRAKPA